MSSYAYGGEGGPGLVGVEFARPIPAHALTPEAEAAREAVRRLAWETRLERIVSSLVTDHGRPHRVPYDGDVVTAGARRLEKIAHDAGWRVNVVTTPDRCAVEGIRGDVAFRAVWVNGRASADSTWHERRYRYAFVEDERPEPKKAELTKLSLARRRPVGVDRIHLTMTASPAGIPVGVTEIEKRVKQ